MSNFDFKSVIRENLYHANYPHDDKVVITLNEGQTLLIEREIHEGIMDILRGYTKEQPGWKAELGKQIDVYLNKSSALGQSEKVKLRNSYLNHLDDLPDEFYQNTGAVADVEDSLQAAAAGDTETANAEMGNALDTVGDLGNADETPTEEVPRAQGITAWSTLKPMFAQYLAGKSSSFAKKRLLGAVKAVLTRTGAKLSAQGAEEVLAMMKQASTVSESQIKEGSLRKLFIESVKAYIENENNK